MLTEQGISEIWLSISYLLGDLTWGFSQLFAGRLVDRTGYYLPLIISLLLKGVTVIFYPEVHFIIALIALLATAGLAEGFLEPARNKAAIAVEMEDNYIHSHFHLNVGFGPSGGFVLGGHKHEHEHEMKTESFVGALQSVGILFFGVGAAVGSWLLIQGIPLEILTIIGGLCLIGASVASIIFTQIEKIKK
jgi:MFS family permease